MVKSDHIVFTFMRSAVASISSAVADIGTRVLFFSIVLSALPEFYRSSIAVAAGAVIGGVVNCTVNYKFTFHADGQNKAGVALKFILCWTGNLLLNMYGTALLVMALGRWRLSESLGISDNLLFAGVTFGVAIVVSVCWNFTVQRCFVYRTTRFDRWLSDHSILPYGK